MEKEDERTDEIQLKLGDIVSIEAPTNRELHQNTFFIDYIDDNKFELILNYSPKMGEQTNGTFFPIRISQLSENNARIYVGANDKSLALKFEEKNALHKLLPKLKAHISLNAFSMI